VDLSKLVNIRGDLFATALTFSLSALIRLVSSLILTRVLLPEAYGTITILGSILYVIGNILDTNVTLFIVRDRKAEEPRYLSTAWTMRLGRSVLSAVVLFACAPLIATKIYDLPSLTLPLRVFSLWFLIDGFNSLAFSVAIRRKQARLPMYSELASSVFTAAFSIIYCYRYHTFWGIAFAMLLDRLIITVLSYQFYRELRPRFLIDPAAAREILVYSKFTIPSSFLTLALNQFDKVIFLRLFDLRLLGIYSLAGNISGSIEAVIAKISQTVLYPRCAHNFRENPATATKRYYTENTKLFASILAMPAALCGASHLIITLLYDTRYSEAGSVLQALAIRAVLLSFASSAEDLLISAGQFHVILTGNVLRTAWIVVGSLVGYHFMGFLGFIYGLSLSGLPPMVYYLWLQKSKGMLIAKYELYKVGFALGVGIASYIASATFLALFPGFRIKF
jgi:O-antigen/teichoic acid export membrane protein